MSDRRVSREATDLIAGSALQWRDLYEAATRETRIDPADCDRADWCPSRYQDSEAPGWFWCCREALGHEGLHRCDGATW